MATPPCDTVISRAEMVGDVAIGATAVTTVATTVGITAIHHLDGRVATGVEAIYRRRDTTTIEGASSGETEV